jgi:hypothetical protein
LIKLQKSKLKPVESMKRADRIISIVFTRAHSLTLMVNL